MKHIIVLAAGFFLVCPVYSQIALGIFGGANVSNVTPLTTPFNGTMGDPTDFLGYNENIAYEQNKPVNGIYAGLVARLKLGGQLTLRPALRWVEKGWLHHSFNNFDYYTSTPVRIYLPSLMNVRDFRYTIHFLELPLDLEYTTPVGPGKAFFGAGPLLSYGLGGNIKGHEYTLPGNDHIWDSTYVVPFFKSGPYYGGSTKRLYWGVNGVIGYEFAMGIFLNIEYEQNLTADQGLKLGVFLFGIGYMFKK